MNYLKKKRKEVKIKRSLKKMIVRLESLNLVINKIVF